MRFWHLRARRLLLVAIIFAGCALPLCSAQQGSNAAARGSDAKGAKAAQPKQQAKAAAKTASAVGNAAAGKTAGKQPSDKAGLDPKFKVQRPKRFRIEPLSGKQLDVAVKQAEKLQRNREFTQETVVANLIAEAPAAELASGDADISTTGPCRNEIDMYCMGVEPGEGRLADCLSRQLLEQAAPDYSGPRNWTDECTADLDAFKADTATNINKNLPLAKACKKDVARRCTGVQRGNGTVIACLRSRPEVLSQRCFNEVFKTEQAAADDIRNDPILYKACKADMSRGKCKGKDMHHGKMQQCLRRNKGSLDWGCRMELFRQAMENADDLRLSTAVFEACLDDKKKFCPKVAPGHARAMDCLERHRTEPDFSEVCRFAIETTLEERATDFRLDPQLRRACKKDIARTCGKEQDLVPSAVQGEDGPVINCLQDYWDELRSPECKLAVHRVRARASEDIRFGTRLGIACSEDRQNFCSQVPPGSARVIRCLQSKRQQLSADCKATLFDEETGMGESIDFQYPMKTACKKELERFCKDVPHEHARAMRCLQDHTAAPQFGDTCRAEVAKHRHDMGSDFRLNFRLAEACQNATAELCAEVKCKPHEPCGGAMLRCLTDKVDSIASDECRKEVEYFQLMEVTDFENDIMLAEACRLDVEKHCPRVPGGRGRVHACLRKKLDKLSEGCRKEETRLMEAASASITLQPQLAADCAPEVAEHCADVRPGSSRVYNCLVASAEQVDFSRRCRTNLATQQIRRLKDWRLDFNLKTACKEDVPRVCRAALQHTKKQGQVLQCLVASMELTSNACTAETVRAVYAGLEFYQPDLPVIRSCDADVAKFCGDDKAQEAWRQGKAPGLGKFGANGLAAANMGVGQVRQCLQKHVPFEVPGGLDQLFLNMAGDATEATGDGEERGRRRQLLRVAQRQLQQYKSVPGSRPGTEAGIPKAATYGQANDPDNLVAGPDDKAAEASPEWPTGDDALQPMCALLMKLGGPEKFDDFAEDLAQGAFAAQMRRVEASLNLPEDTLVAPQPNKEGDAMEDALTLTGWAALAGTFALAAVILGGAVIAWRRWHAARYGAGYTMVVKNPPRQVEMQ